MVVGGLLGLAAGALLIRDQFMRTIWVAPSDLQTFARGDDLTLHIRPDHRILAMMKEGNGKGTMVFSSWTGEMGQPWPLGFYHWHEDVPIAGPNWRRASVRPVFMAQTDELSQSGEVSYQFVTFGDDFLEIDDIRFERVATDLDDYCGSVLAFNIPEFDGSPCHR